MGTDWQIPARKTTAFFRLKQAHGRVSPVCPGAKARRARGWKSGRATARRHALAPVAKSASEITTASPGPMRAGCVFSARRNLADRGGTGGRRSAS